MSYRIRLACSAATIVGVAATILPRLASAQAPSSTPQPAPTPTTQPAPGYPPAPAPTTQPAPGYPPASAPGYAPPAPGYAPGYPPAPPGYQQPAAQPGYPPGYQQPGYPPPGYPPPGYPPPPGYQQPGAYGYVEPPLPPPPPKRAELKWSIRLDALDLLFGTLGGEVEYAFAGPLSIGVGPQYMFASPLQNSSLDLKAKGQGIYGELGFWIEGRPLRGYYLKAHVSHSSVTFRSYEADGVTQKDQVDVPQTLIGLMFGSQSIYAGWFSLSGGVGILYDTQAQDRTIRVSDPNYDPYTLPGPGLFSGSGFVLLPQLSLGGSF